MLSPYPHIDQETGIITDTAGMLGGNGPLVEYQVALADDHETRPAIGIVMGCGALAVHYEDFQARLRDDHAISSVCAERLYVPSLHPNRLQSEVVEQSLVHAGNAYGLNLNAIYGHSWGAAILASLINAGVYKVDLAILHAMAGDQSPFRNILRNPGGIISGAQRELARGYEVSQSRGEDPADAKLDFPGLSLAQLAVLPHHMYAASETRNVGRHLKKARAAGTRLVGLWPEYDVMFRRRHHPLMHENRVMPGSVHTETQSNPAGIAAEVARLLFKHKLQRLPSRTVQTQHFAVAGA